MLCLLTFSLQRACVKVPIISEVACKEQLKDTDLEIASSMVCAGGQGGGACKVGPPPYNCAPGHHPGGQRGAPHGGRGQGTRPGGGRQPRGGLGHQLLWTGQCWNTLLWNKNKQNTLLWNKITGHK